MEPKVSVIIPVYNVEEYLPRCLDSIVNQSLSDIEIICIDDQSPDNSLSILQQYAARDRRIMVHSQRNMRQGGARNTGFDLAKGEFVAFIDSDDWIDLDYLERLYKAAIENRADIACAPVRKIRGNRQKWNVEIQELRVSESLQEKFYLCHCPPNFNTTNKLYRREALVEGGVRFREHAQYEDVEYLSQALAKLGRLVTVPGPRYWYFVHENSTTKSVQTPKKQEDKYLAHRAFVDFAHQHNLRLASRYSSITKRFWTLGNVTILKIKERDSVLTWRLFDIIPIYRKSLK